MKPEDFAKSFDFLLDSMLSWAKCVRHPFLTCKNILAESEDETKAIKMAVKLWITSYIMSMLLLGWAYKLHGIEITNLGFYLTSAFLVFAFLVLFVLSLHVGFTIFRLPAPFQDTFVVYTVIISAFMPFSSILVSPSLVQTLNTLKTLKARDLDLSDAVVTFWSMTAAPPASTVNTLSTIAVVLTVLLGLFMLSTILDMLASRWDVERVRVYAAGSFGMTVVLILPMALLSLIHMVMMYSFL